jgi:hypothetical protein
LKGEELEQSVGDNSYENIWSRRDIQHATPADSLGSVLLDDMIVYLHVIVNDMRFLTALFPLWSIDMFTICVPLLVAPSPVFRLLLCQSPPLTRVTSQGTPEDGNVITVQFAGVADGAMYGPASKLDLVLLNNSSFVVYIVHLDVGAGMTNAFKDLL